MLETLDIIPSDIFPDRLLDLFGYYSLDTVAGPRFGFSKIDHYLRKIFSEKLIKYVYLNCYYVFVLRIIFFICISVTLMF